MVGTLTGNQRVPGSTPGLKGSLTFEKVFKIVLTFWPKILPEKNCKGTDKKVCVNSSQKVPNFIFVFLALNQL